MEEEHYFGREQSQVKHEILTRYLERFARIVGTQWKSITYVDAFAGPWNAISPELTDTSFSVALQELRSARETLRKKNRHLGIRCLFLERDPGAFRRLKEWADGVKDAQITVLPREFEPAIPEIVAFVRQDRATFPFVFVDPTGWKGFGLRTIEPLLELQPGEVLINFMTSFIRRFMRRLRQAGKLPYDDLWACSLSYPLVQEGDLKRWLDQWHRDQLVDLLGLGPGERRPKVGGGHEVYWHGAPPTATA